MDTSRFADRDSTIEIFDFRAIPAWRNISAISFHLGRHSDYLMLPDFDEPRFLGHQIVFNCFGWLDVVHPCLDHIRARMRVSVGDLKLDNSSRSEFVSIVFNALSIPDDETYEAHFFTTSEHTSIDQPVDRHGYTDRT